MKKYIIISLALAACLLLAACNKDNGRDGAKAITVKAEIGSLTKAAYDGVKSSFAAGDALSLFVWTGDNTVIPAEGPFIVGGVVNTLKEDGKWWPETQMLWDDMTTPHYFMAVSPVRDILSFTEDPYSLLPAADSYQQSDLLIATNVAGLVATSNPVELVFDHAMAKLNVNLTFRNQWTQGNPPEAPNTEAIISMIQATAKTGATINYINKVVTVTGENSSILLNKVTNASWTTLMVPQEGFRTIEIFLSENDEWWGGNGLYKFTHSADIPLESGKVTTVNLIVGRDQINLKEGGITITDWAAGEVINNGEAQIPEIEPEQD